MSEPQAVEARTWTHPSVKALAKDGDPVAAMIARMRSLVLDATDKGWAGPPFDPIALAGILHLAVVPREDIDDARTVPSKGAQVQIEFQPNRPKGRLRFSIAHEIAHTIFPDCAERIRNRVKANQMGGDDWQLEMLCNIGAAEILMPVGSFPALRDEDLSVDHLMQLRKEYEVSTEAIFLRACKLTAKPCLVFAASRVETAAGEGNYRLDYAIPSNTWGLAIRRGLVLPPETLLAECTAIGFTAKGTEAWPEIDGTLEVQCVGIPPYPGHSYPRVMGILSAAKRFSTEFRDITYLVGDATKPRGQGLKIIAQVVNDKTPNWGGGFARVIRKTWPFVQEDFVRWAGADRAHLALGNARVSEVDGKTCVFNMVCQHGYGPSPKPRIRYGALASCLRSLAEIAIQRKAFVHMPRIACGEAGGDWSVVSELIREFLCERGLAVTVYDLPNKENPRPVAENRLF